MKYSSSKLIYLECARGIASFFVVFHHLSLAFFPWVNGSILHGGVKYTPLYIIFNGSGAVIFFFTLSGFVLTYSHFKNASIQKLAQSVIKRLPRLMGPSAITILVGYFIVSFDLGNYKLAAEFTGSQWLRDFANANFPVGFHPSLTSAITQFFFVFISPHNFYYNSNLWTMRNEFLGSMLVFGLIPIFLIKWKNKSIILIALHILLFVTMWHFHPAFSAFIAGSFLAYLRGAMGVHLITGRISMLWVTLAPIFLFSTDNEKLNIIAAIVTMALLLEINFAQNIMSGRIASLIGALSFPLYIVHTLVILSITSTIFIYLHNNGADIKVNICLLTASTFLISIVFAVPLVLMEAFWVPKLNRIAETLVERLNLFAKM